MRTLRDFCCGDCGHRVEKLMDVGVETIECVACGGQSKQQMGMPTVRLEGISGDFPGAANKWASIREDNARRKAARS